MNSHDLSPPEWFFLHGKMQETFAHLPKSGKFQPCLNISSGELDDAYHALRENAVYSRAKVEKIVEEKKNSGAWPRGQYGAKFWLRARWEMAISACRGFAEKSKDSASQSLPAKVAQEASRWLWLDMWDQLLVDYWLQENIGDCVYFDSYGMYPDRIAEIENWINEVRNGAYLKP